MAMDYAARLAGLVLFGELPAAALAELAAAMHLVHYEANAIIFREADPGHTCLVILQGLVKVYRESENGREVVLAILGSGDMLGELSLPDGLPRSACAAALEPVDVLVLRRDDFLRYMVTSPETAVVMLRLLSSRLRRTDGLIADAAFLDLTERVASVLLDLGRRFGREAGRGVEVPIRLRQHDIAAMVGVTRESVNRTLALLEAEGLISYSRQRITILNPAGLRARLGASESASTAR